MSVFVNKRFAAAFIVAAICMNLSAFATVYQSATSDDIWAYMYGGKASTLRAWGDGVNALAPTFPYAGSGYEHFFAYSYLGWNVGSIADGEYVVTSATLTITQTANCGYSLASAQEKPIEARALNQIVSEAAWSYSSSANQNPSEMFGIGDMSNYHPTAQFSITIDLMGYGDFQSYFNAAVNGDNQISLAVTSAKLANMEGSSPYKFWSKDDLGYEAYAPILNIEYAPVPEPSALAVLATGILGLITRLRRK